MGITMPVVKHSYLLQTVDAAPTATFREAFHIAKTGRPGPVLIDVPSDLASDLVTFEYPDDVDLPSYKPTYRGNAKQVKQAVARIKQAVRPVLYVGGGVVSSGAGERARGVGRSLHAHPRGHHAHGQGRVPRVARAATWDPWACTARSTRTLP